MDWRLLVPSNCATETNVSTCKVVFRGSCGGVGNLRFVLLTAQGLVGHDGQQRPCLLSKRQAQLAVSREMVRKGEERGWSQREMGSDDADKGLYSNPQQIELETIVLHKIITKPL